MTKAEAKRKAQYHILVMMVNAIYDATESPEYGYTKEETEMIVNEIQKQGDRVAKLFRWEGHEEYPFLWS
ncbi:MAG: hypothetical protein MJA84_01635 [Firmicutes bacterium]|nr:hypothetical protein [Bacillota bacterium]